MPGPHLAMLSLLFFLFAAGQHFESPRRQTSFPFVQWDMFSRIESSDRITYYEYEGTRADGSRVRLNAAALFPPMRHARLTAALMHQVEAADRDPSADRTALVETIAALGREFNRSHRADPVRAVEIVKTTIELEQPPTFPGVREPIERVEL